MDFFPDVKSLDKLLSNNWKTFVYGEQSETWNQKLYSFALEAWNQILIFFESRGKQLQNYWPLYAGFIVASFIILATYKSLRYVGPIKLWKSNKCEQRAKQDICAEEPKIISDDVNDDTGCFVEKPCSTSRSDLDNATSADNDFHSRHDFSVSSATTVIAVEGKESGEFLTNLINSFEPGDDTVNYIVSTKYSREDTEENKEITNLPESTLQKVDSNNCKHFYVLTPWIGPPEVQESKPAENTFNSSSVSDDYNTKAESLVHQSLTSRSDQEDIEENSHSDLVKSQIPPNIAAVDNALTDDKKSTVQMASESAYSTLAINHESSSICCADEVLSRNSNTGENIHVNEEKPCGSTIPKIEPQSNNLERLFGNMIQRLPELDLSPISRDPVKIEKAIIATGSVNRTDSKHRFRSLSHDSRTVSSADYIDARRGSSVSPPARNKNKHQRSVKQMQSKIPTLSPLAHRQMQQHLGTDGTVAETANQIRSVLLRKLKEVWEKHPRDRTQSPNRSINSSHNNSHNSSIYYTPESVSKIPLPRRSPRSNDTNSPTQSPRANSQVNRSANQSEQSRTRYDGILSVPLHSTPKTSPLSRGSNRRR